MNMIICYLWFIALHMGDDMVEIRKSFHTMDNETQVLEFIEKYKNSPFKNSKPYLAAAIMRKAKYQFFPQNKLLYFIKGKKMLESYIEQHSKSIEGRYVRILVQTHTPSFLGYNKHIKEDKRFIRSMLASSCLPVDYQKLILNNIK